MTFLARLRPRSGRVLAARTALLAVPLGLGAVVLTGAPTQAHGFVAQTTLRAADGTPVGHARFAVGRYRTHVAVRLDTEGRAALNAFHGLHVHANNDPANGTGCVADPAAAPATWFVSADGHLSAPGQTHSSHLGDLPSVLVNQDGKAELRFTTGRLTRGQLAGRALVLHAGPDNFGNVPTGTAPDQYRPNSPAATTATANTGNSGARIACGTLTVRR